MSSRLRNGVYRIENPSLLAGIFVVLRQIYL